MLDRGDFDLVAVGRALIANPDWVRVLERGDVNGLIAFEKPMLMTLD
jgi:2,4-dienoyl-CoA reductase-like NADH-dependent reductase (Old Yellow Enzyme family)